MEIAKKQLQKEGAKMPASTYFKPMTPRYQLGATISCEATCREKCKFKQILHFPTRNLH